MTISRVLLATVGASLMLAHAALAQAPAPTPAPAPAAAPAIASPAAPVVAAPGTVPAPAPVTAVAVPPPAVAPIAAPVAPPITREEIPALVKKALLDNPEILVEVAQRYRDKQEAEMQKKASEAIVKNKDVLQNDKGSPFIGNPNADLTIVEFFDYRCGYCHQLTPALMKLVEDDKNLRVVLKDFPILSEESLNASRVAVAIHRIAPDKYSLFHQELMKGSPKLDQKSLMDTAKRIGVDTKKLDAELKNPEVDAQLDKNRKLAEELGIRGTPGLIIGNQLIPGAMSLEELKKEVAKARALAGTSAPTAVPAAN